MKKTLKVVSLVLVLMLLMPAVLVVAAACKPPVVEKEEYTYRTSTQELPTNWNIHSYKSNSATTVLDYTEDGFYTFDYNEDRDGYKLIPSMAKDFPIDVTADYKDQFGLAGETALAWKIPLRDDLKFQNGDVINSDTYVESAKLLLDPEMMNSRADDHFYGGDLKVVNAKNYLYQGKTVLVDSMDKYEHYDEADDADLYFALFGWDNNSSPYFGKWGKEKGYFSSNKTAADVIQKNWVDDLDVELVMTMVGVSLKEIKEDAAMKAEWEKLLAFWQTDPDEELHFLLCEDTFPEVSWDNVGILSLPQENAIVMVLEKELEGFYLNYALTSGWLVHAQTYKSCISSDKTSNSYATTKDRYVGYGPYMLDTFITDSAATFVKNPYWWGYTSGEMEGMYQTTKISIQVVKDASVRLEMFLKGELDTYGLDKEDFEDYQSSPHAYYTEGQSTWYIAFNPLRPTLETEEARLNALSSQTVKANKTIFTVKEFRQALSFSLDRLAFIQATSPESSVAKALFGNLIVSDPDNGTAYRTTIPAQDAVLSFWGLSDSWGPGKEYATREDAIASITGYDLAGARVAFEEALDIAIADPTINLTKEDVDSGKFEVHIRIGKTSATSNFGRIGYEFLKKTWTEAVIGTRLEGKLIITDVVSNASEFGDHLREGRFEMLFGVGYGGSALNPYGLVDCFTDSSSSGLAYDTGFDKEAAMIDIEIEGKTLRASLHQWGTLSLNGEDITCQVIGSDGQPTGETKVINAGSKCEADTRLAILAACEKRVLEEYNILPLMTDATVSLKGMKIIYGSEEYVYGVARGGMQYYKYKYTDSEWAKYVSENSDGSGKLNYKGQSK